MMRPAASLAPTLGQQGAADDRQRDHRGERAGGQRDGTIEAGDPLEASQDAQHEGRPQPEGEGPQHPLAVDSAALDRHSISPVDAVGRQWQVRRLAHKTSVPAHPIGMMRQQRPGRRLGWYIRDKRGLIVADQVDRSVLPLRRPARSTGS